MKQDYCCLTMEEKEKRIKRIAEDIIRLLKAEQRDYELINLSLEIYYPLRQVRGIYRFDSMIEKAMRKIE